MCRFALGLLLNGDLFIPSALDFLYKVSVLYFLGGF